MTNQKGKMFRFEESDLEWINPLLLEWTEENEGKKKSDLITELLTDYKNQRETKALAEERAQKLKTYVDKVKAPLDTGFNAVNTKISAATGKLDDKIDSTGLDAKIDRANERLNKSLTKTATGIDKFLARSSEKIKGIIKKSESEE
jgi:hypothetical protein